MFKISITLIIFFFSSIKAITELDFKPAKYSLPYPPVLVPNNKLANVVRIVENQINGAESLFLEQGGRVIYTGTTDGKLLKIVVDGLEGKIEKSVKINGGNAAQKCGTYDTQPICGSPHKIRRLSPEYLVTIDAYLGLYKFNLDKGEVVNLLPGNYKFDKNGTQCALFNSIEVLKNGTKIIISCSSIRWDNRRAIHDFFEGQPNGRLFEYDVATGQAQTIPGIKLDFANGIQAHPDNQSVIVSELTRARIFRYYYDGPKKGKTEMFVENLPGFPDNIKPSADGKSFFVGIDLVRHSEQLSTVEKLGPYPEIRFNQVMLIPEANLRSFYGNNLIKKYGMALELDLNGNIINSYQDPTGEVIPSMSEAMDNGTHLFIGSGSATSIAIVRK